MSEYEFDQLRLQLLNLSERQRNLLLQSLGHLSANSASSHYASVEEPRSLLPKAPAHDSSPTHASTLPNASSSIFCAATVLNDAEREALNGLFAETSASL